MTKRDARKLTPATQEEIRRQAIKLYESGMRKGKIAEQLDVYRNAIGKWIRLYSEGGKSALKAQKRGPKQGSLMQLAQKDQKRIRKIITDKYPEQLKLSFALWTREAVGQLIEQLTTQKLDLRQVGRYLKRWGFTPQRPTRQAYQRNEKHVEQWLNEDYPAIKAAAEQDSAVQKYSGWMSRVSRAMIIVVVAMHPRAKHPCASTIPIPMAKRLIKSVLSPIAESFVLCVMKAALITELITHF